MYFSDAPQIEEISINKMITKYKKIKPSFACVYYQNGNSCKLYGLNDQGNVIGNGTYISRGEKTRRYLCHHCGKAFCDHTCLLYTSDAADE